MHGTHSRQMIIVAAGLLAISGCSPPQTGSDTVQTVQTVQSVDMGDYEVVLDWPKPLPDDDLSHDGWTWGSGAGVLVESTDKVWVAQRGESNCRPAPNPGSAPVCWSRAGPTPAGGPTRATSTLMRCGGTTSCSPWTATATPLREWLQHDEYLAPPRGSGLGEVGRGPHKLLMNPYDPDRHIWIVDDDMHEISVFTNDGLLVKTMGERGVPGRGPNNFNRPTDIAWLPDGTFFVADGYAGTRVAKFDPDGNFVLDWGRRRSTRPIPARTSSGPSTASASAATAASSSPTASTAGCRSSTKTATSWKCGPRVTTHRSWPTSSPSMISCGWPIGPPGGSSSMTSTVGISWTSANSVRCPASSMARTRSMSTRRENLYITEVANDRSQKFRPKPTRDRPG